MIFASSNTLEKLTALINKFYYTTTCRVENGAVFNSKGIIAGVEVVEKKGRFYFQTSKS